MGSAAFATQGGAYLTDSGDEPIEREHRTGDEEGGAKNPTLQLRGRDASVAGEDEQPPGDDSN